MAKVTKEVDVIYNQKSTGKGTQQIVDGLKAVENQANRTREKMEKLANVGTKLALVGGAILAPLALAMKKYVDTTKGTERVSARIVALNERWEASQVRLGRIVATQVLPLLEQGAKVLDKVITFAEKNPGVVKAALTIGSTLVILGGILATTAQLVSTVATIQGLAASAGLLSVGGGAAGGAAAGAAAGGGLAATIVAGLSTFFTSVFVPLLSVVIGGQIGLGLGNALAGTNQTWADIGRTIMTILELNKIFFTRMLPQMLSNLGAAIGNGIKSLWNAITSLFRGGRASGGYVGAGFYVTGERGREFVLDNKTTTNAEHAVGGKLTQKNINAFFMGKLNEYGILKTASMSSGLADIRERLKALSPNYSSGQLAAMQAAKMSNQPNDLRIAIGKYLDIYTPSNLKDTFLKPGQYMDTYTPRPRSGNTTNQTYNLQVGNGMTIAQTRRMIRANEAAIMGSLAGAFS